MSMRYLTRSISCRVLLSLIVSTKAISIFRIPLPFVYFRYLRALTSRCILQLPINPTQNRAPEIMEFFPMDDVGESYLQYSSTASLPISDTLYPTSSHPFPHTNFTSTNLGYVTHPLPPPSGYLISHRKTTDARQGEVLRYALLSSGIDVRGSPPFMPVTNKASFTSNGVVKISNVSTRKCPLRQNLSSVQAIL